MLQDIGTASSRHFSQHRFLRQEYSWGRLLVTEDTFASIQDSCNVFPPLGDHVSSFAFKTSDRDEHFAACDRRVHLSDNEGPADQIAHGS